MSDNSKLVEYFTDQYLACNTKRMEPLVAADFICYINLGDPLNFEKFIARMWSLSYSSKVSNGVISSDDDTHFYYDFKRVLPHPNDGKQAVGMVQVVPKNGLISRIYVDYEISEKNYQDFITLMDESRTALI